MTTTPTNEPSPPETVERYMASRFDWAAPGDQQEDAWLVRFCDKDCGEAVFTGPDAEREAWEHYERYAPSFNIYVFRLARLRPDTRTTAESASCEALLEALDEALLYAEHDSDCGANINLNIGCTCGLAGVLDRARAAIAAVSAPSVAQDPFWFKVKIIPDLDGVMFTVPDDPLSFVWQTREQAETLYGAFRLPWLTATQHKTRATTPLDPCNPAPPPPDQPGTPL